MNRIRLISSLFAMLAALLLVAGCKDLGNYQPISGVSDEINALGKKIAQAQRGEVWTGGNEASGCYMDSHASSFHAENKLKDIVLDFVNDSAFTAGIGALKKLTPQKREEILTVWAKPIDKTWRESGQIGNGTTDAGQAVESQIAAALVDAIRAKLPSVGAMK